MKDIMTIKDFSKMLEQSFTDEIYEIKSFLRNLDLNDLPKGMYYSRSPFEDNDEYVLTLHYSVKAVPISLSKDARAIICNMNCKYDNARKYLDNQCGIHVGEDGINIYHIILYKPAVNWLYSE